jgi:hypothetical protein
MGLREVEDLLQVREGDPACTLRLRRDVRAFFRATGSCSSRSSGVVALVPPGPVVDLAPASACSGCLLRRLAAGR